VIDRSDKNLDAAKRLYAAVDGDADPETLLSDWLTLMENSIDLRTLLESADNRTEDLEEYRALVFATEHGQSLNGLRLGEFAREGRVKGKVVVTTYHSSKGRQFDVVILPALQEGIMPYRRRDRYTGSFAAPAKNGLAGDRRLFYVGFTRARNFVFLLYSTTYHNDYGQLVPNGASRFIDEINERLKSG
jgi:DNA helicase-2/ATP-dependent DNA helicase PcrA